QSGFCRLIYDGLNGNLVSTISDEVSLTTIANTIVQLTLSHCWMGRHPTDDSLPAWTELKRPTCCGNEKNPVHLPPEYAKWPTLPHPPASSSAPTTVPNAMDLSAFQCGPDSRLFDAKRACRVQLNLCFRCGQAGHVSCGFSNRNRKFQGRQKSLSSAQISELQAKINRISTNPSTTNP
ncbi:uncharacterized protein VP01_8857g1, partial [Puccinia sorghi]